MIAEGVLPAISVELGLDEGFLIEVLAFFLIFIHPKVGKHLSYLIRHQTREDGITGILCRCRQYAAVEVFVDLKVIIEFWGKHSPLVVTEIIEHHKEHLLTFVEQREYLRLEDLWRHYRTLNVLLLYPVEIVLFDKLRKS